MIRSPFLLLAALYVLQATGCSSPEEAKDPATWLGEWESFIDSGNVSVLEADEDYALAVIDGELRMSLDEGESWESPVLPGLGSAKINSALFSNDRWFAGVEDGRVYVTTDFGSSWTVKTTMPENSRLQTYGLHAYATSKPAGVFKLDDDNVTWLRSDDGMATEEVGAMVYSSAVVYAGTILTGNIYQSKDLGATWQLSDSGFTGTSVLDLVPGVGVVLAASGEQGAFASADRGVSWSSVNAGLPARIYAQTAAATRDVLYLGGSFSTNSVNNENTIYRSTDKGKNWESADGGLPLVQEVSSLAISNRFLLAATRGRGIWRRKIRE